MHPAWIEIDLAQFKKNIAIVKNVIGDARLCLPIKANAYGHGLIPIAKAAIDARVDYLAVAHVQEGVLLRRANITTPIIVLGAIHEDQIEALLHHDLEFTLSSPYKARLVAQSCAQLNKIARVHLEVDTGMRRTGMRPATAAALFDELLHNPCFHLVGVYSHLATGNSPSDHFALRQIEEFASLMSSPPFAGEQIIRHLANSSATQYLPSSYFDMVRPALLCFGYKAGDAPHAFAEIAPCFSLKARVSFFKIVEEGEGISYGHTHRARARTRVVTIPVGYGDGYKRALSNRGSVLIHGKRYPIVGTVCMDQFMVDVGEDSVYVGDEVVLIGHQGDQVITVDEIASHCDTIPYEILCLFNDRIERRYLVHDQILF
jgi:alanine racemase